MVRATRAFQGILKDDVLWLEEHEEKAALFIKWGWLEIVDFAAADGDKVAEAALTVGMVAPAVAPEAGVVATVAADAAVVAKAVKGK